MENFPLRPLLFAVGAAATALSIYCYVKRGEKKTTAEPENTTAPKDPVCKQDTEPALVRPTEVLQDQMTEDVTEAEEKIQKHVVSITQLEDRVRELEELLCEARSDCDKVSVAEADEKHQKAVEAIAQMKEEESDVIKPVETPRDTVKECEREWETHSILQEENNELKKSLIHEELLKVSVAKAEEKHQKDVETIIQLEEEKSDLTKQVESLRGTVKECERERETHSILQTENDKMMKTLIHEKELMKVSVSEAEEKHQKSVETIAQLEEEKSDLTKQVETLRDNVEDMRHLLHKHNIEAANLTKACVQEWEELLKVSVAEAGEKHEKDVETITQLKEEKSDLTKQVETLRDLVKECERERETHSILETENEELKKTLIHEKELLLKVSVIEAEEKHQNDVETIAQLEEEKSDLTKQLESLRDTVKECEKERETHSILQMENDKILKTLIHEKELMKVSVSEAEEKHQKDLETIAQLEEEKSDLTKQVETLRDNVEDMRHLLEKHNIEAANLTKACVQEWEHLLKVSMAKAEKKHHKAVETITQLKEEKSDLTKQVESLRDTVKECEKERETHSILQAENDEMMKTLIHQKELINVSVAEAEEKHQKSVETITQLEEEKSDLTKVVETLRDMVKECEKERETHSILQTENNELKKSLIHEKLLLKVSVAEAENKHEKTVETIAQIEKMMSDLTKEVESLRDTVKECERERETHSILQMENDKILKTLIHEKELLKVSMAEAEKKHQMAIETIAQLEEEKSDLTKEVETLRDTVTKSERERKTHSILQTENDEMMKTLVHEKELIKVSMVEAEKKHQMAVETIAQLEKKKCDLTKQVETLKDTVKECERWREAHSILQAENDDMLKTLVHEKELLKVSTAEAEEKHQVAVETIAQLEKEKSDLAKQVARLKDIGHLLIDRNVKFANLTKMFEREREEFMKVSLAKGEEKHQKDVETIAQLEEEKSDLTKQVETLRDTVKDMGNDLFESHREGDEHINDQEREAHRILQLEYDELKKTPTHKEELLKVSLAEAEEKHQKAVETIAQLEAEKSDLSEEVDTLRKTVQDMGNDLFETHRECDRLTDEFEQEREAHRFLQSEYHEMKKTQEDLTKNN